MYPIHREFHPPNFTCKVFVIQLIHNVFETHLYLVIYPNVFEMINKDSTRKLLCVDLVILACISTQLYLTLISVLFSYGIIKHTTIRDTLYYKSSCKFKKSYISVNILLLQISFQEHFMAFRFMET